MEIIENRQLSESSVNYDDPPIAEAQVEGVDYRVDPGRGSAVAVSTREAGTWIWTPLTEGRWDGRRLRAKGLDHAVASLLGQALADSMSKRDEPGAD